MEDEYETLTADTPENVATIFRWMKEGCVERNDDEVFVLTNRGTIIFGWQYRRKKPQTDVLLTDPEEIMRGIRAGVVECIHWNGGWLPATVPDSQFIATKLGLGLKYRLKHGYKLPPKKTKKLVPRTAEEFWPLIGKWWCRREENKTYRFLILNSNGIPDQENWEIAPLGSEEWKPMMVFKEVEGEE